MDIDAIHQPSLEVPADDDLINYESDVGDYSLVPAQDLSETIIPDAFEDPLANAEITNESGETDATNPPGDHTMNNTAETIDDTIEHNADEQQNVTLAAESELPLDADAAGAALDALTETVADEIDYSLGEVDYSAGQTSEVPHVEQAVDEPAANAQHLEPERQEERAEISWEEDAADAVLAQPDQQADGTENQLDEQTNEAEFSDLVGQTNAEDEETESRDYRQDELQALEDVITQDASMDVTQDFHIESNESQFPNITVQYQGDEFPFLSSGTEGFFSDSSILDDTMQNIFAGFRSQLGNDLRAEDELVFQIDELGLEFTESNTSSSLTMHQILEVFELLIKNDDPDGSRTLYTYLFTRINSARRYEFLVESATSGKGLEAIQHLFPQQSSHNDSDAENGDDSAMSSEHAEDHEEEYEQEHAHEHSENDEHGDEHHDESHGEYTEENDDNHGEDNFEEVADVEHEEVEYFNEAAEQEGEASHVDVSVVEATEQVDNAEAAEHDDSFAHEHSSTTSTLQGDADGTALADDETAVDADADGPVFVTEANDDAEIDWRDDDENDLAGDGGSVTGKRSRDDNEEPDADDEIDFKRRRP